MFKRILLGLKKNKIRSVDLVFKRIDELNSWRKIYGSINLIHRYRNKKSFEVELSKEHLAYGSSITDSHMYATYPTLCGLAAADEKIFKKFRSSRPMIAALDHVSIELGNEYIEEIITHTEWMEEFTKAIERIDSKGRAKKYKFGSLGTFSPTLLRYLKVYVDLNSYFGPLDKLRISEIGIGFGGQASLINLLGNTRDYNFYDIPPVLQLAQKFISEIGISGNFKYFDGRNPASNESDLVISNYAFSEINAELQKIYFENVVSKSPRGYITWNSLSQDNFGGYSLREFAKLIPHSRILEERPKSDDRNAILIWGENSNSIVKH
jgi:hypothetical protein